MRQLQPRSQSLNRKTQTLYLVCREYLAVIIDEGRRLSRLIGNVLTFGRGRRGAFRIHPEPHRIDDVVEAVVRLFEPSLNSKGVSVRLAKGADQYVAIDADVLEQILGNLLSNVLRNTRNLRITRHEDETVYGAAFEDLPQSWAETRKVRRRSSDAFGRIAAWFVGKGTLTASEAAAARAEYDQLVAR